MKITRPTLLLDEAKCRTNIRKMTEKARAAGVIFRPHFKTHQSAEVGEWFKELGVNQCTVSSVKMAAYFADAGWKDITVAFPLNALEVSEINRMAGSIRLNLTAVGPEELALLIPQLKHPVGCFIEIDSGYRRTGIRPEDQTRLESTLAVMTPSSQVTFKGFLTHAGNSYASKSAAEILQVHKNTTTLMQKVGDRYRQRFPELIVSVGDTPTCSVASAFDGIQEIRPGNFVFYDWMQVGVGACRVQDVAMAMACPVVAVYPERNEVVVHGGGVHFSKDNLRQPDGMANFGQMVKWEGGRWGDTMPVFLKSLSQEHGILHASADQISNFKPGDVVAILPIHSCLTADVLGSYTTLEGRRIMMMTKVD